MRTMISGTMMSGAMMLAVLTGASAGAQEAAESSKYSAPISVTKGTVTIRATATFSDGSSADRLYRVTRDTDSDGDGVSDESWLRIACSGGAVAAAFEYEVKSPRDVATGQSSGKRMHKPFTIIKEWGPSTPMFRATAGKAGAGTVSWDLATGKGARSAGWNIKENKGARDKQGSASDSSAGKDADGKTMGMDDWHQVTLKDGASSLCS